MKVTFEVESGLEIEAEDFTEALEEHLIGVELDVLTRQWDKRLGCYVRTSVTILSVST